MIRVHRGPEPAALATRRIEWTDRWKRIRSGAETGDWATGEARTLLCDALTRISHGKCVYCEGPLNAQCFPEIEHYTAKTVDDDLAFAWTNLFMACRACNGKKGAKDHDGQLLKPDLEDPEPLLWMTYDGRIEARVDLDSTSAERVAYTTALCDLNRGDLVEARFRLRGMMEALLSVPRSQAGAQWWAALHLLLEPKQPYKLVVRQTLEALRYSELAEKDRERCGPPT